MTREDLARAATAARSMQSRDRRRQELLDELRRLHRAEPAPAELRQRLLAERGSARKAPAVKDTRGVNDARAVAQARIGVRWGFPRVALAVVAAFGVALALRWTLNEWRRDDAEALAPSPHPLELGPEPPASVRIPAPSDSLAAATAERARQCPLRAVPSGTVLMPQHSGLPGFSAHTFEQAMPSCGSITRRYLARVPPELAERTRAPVLILLHDAGEAAESSHPGEGRPDFEDVARRNGIVLIYANAAPGRATSVGVADSGAWQTDPRTHREIDDEEYLRLILMDLGRRRVIAGDNDIFLVGRGDGAAMALRAAMESRGRYTGVAAFAPSIGAFVEPARPRASEHLTRVMIVLQVPERGSGEAWRLSTPMFARRWGSVLGIEQKVIARSWTFGDPDKPSGTLRQLDVALPATGSSGVRLYVLDGAVETPPNAAHAWDFLSGIDGADPEPEGLPELPTVSPRDVPLELVPDLPMLIVPDGQSVLSEDAEGTGYPEVVLDGDTVTAPRQPARRQP